MSLIDIRLVDPRSPNEYSEYVNGWTQMTFSSDRKAPGACTFTLPRDADNRDLMETYQLFALLQDGVEADNCRYLIRRITGADMPTDQEPVPAYVYTCASIWDALRDIEIPNPGTNDQIVFQNTTVGQIFYSVLSTIAGQGLLDWWGYDGMTFTATTDSEGQPWLPIESVQFTDGQSVFELVDWLIQHHYLEVSTTRSRVNAYNPDTRGLDLSKAQRPVKLAEGYDLNDAPWERTYDDVATAVTVIGGGTNDPTNSGQTRPKLKVKVYAVGVPVLQQDFAVPLGYGNFYGGYTRHDKNRVVAGKDWAARIPAQIDAILQSGAWLWGALELHEETADDLPAGGNHYFLSELKERDPDWDIFEGLGGNHALYRPSRLAPVSRENLQMPGARAATEYLWIDPISGFQFHLMLAHLRANDLKTKNHPAKSRDKERKQQAAFLVKRIKKWKHPGFLMADINDRTHRQGNAREIIEASGLLGLRDREPNLPYHDKNSLSGGNHSVWIEDIWSTKNEKVTNSRGILTNDSSDHDLYFATTLTFRAGVPQQQSRFGIRERRISVEGVQSLNDLRTIGKKWIALRQEPRESHTYSTTVVETPQAPMFRQPAVAARPPAQFKRWAGLVPGNRSWPVHGMARSAKYTYLSQFDGTRTVVTRYNGKTRSGTMTVPVASTDALKVETVVKDPAHRNADTDWIMLPAAGTGLADPTSQAWIRLPWTTDKAWTAPETVPYTMRIPPARDPLTRTARIQGETGPMQDYYWRSYGSAQTTNGYADTPATPDVFQTIRGGVVLDTVSTAATAVDALSATVVPATRVEPAGLTQTLVNGWPHLLIGFCTGTAGSYAQVIYSYPILIDELGAAYVDRNRAQFVPTVDYGPGDTILIDLANGLAPRPGRVEVISGSCDDDTSAEYRITTDDWLAGRDVAVDRLLAKYGSD